VNKKSIKSDLARIDRMRDADSDDSDIPAIDRTLLQKATTAWPPAKTQLTIRLDADVLDWLKGQGKGLPDAHQPHSAHGGGESALPLGLQASPRFWAAARICFRFPGPEWTPPCT
jgi:uncharacterized protein (DUF4415 family)